MKTTATLSLCTAALLLAGCGEAGEQAKSTFNQEARSRFVTAATELCMEKVPKNTPLPQKHLTALCGCTAETVFDQVPAEDLARILSGKPDAKLTAAISRATVECAGKAMSAKAASSER